MEPTTVVLAVIVALQVMYSAYQKFKGEALGADVARAGVDVDMAKLVDKRIRDELSRQDTEIKELKGRVLHLERIEAEYRAAQLVLAQAGIEWPPQNMNWGGV